VACGADPAIPVPEDPQEHPKLVMMASDDDATPGSRVHVALGFRTRLAVDTAMTTLALESVSTVELNDRRRDGGIDVFDALEAALISVGLRPSPLDPGDFEGEAYCWGSNRHGMGGVGITETLFVPTPGLGRPPTTSTSSGPASVHWKQIRYWLLIRMLCCPRRSAFSASSRSPGGDNLRLRVAESPAPLTFGPAVHARVWNTRPRYTFTGEPWAKKADAGSPPMASANGRPYRASASHSSSGDAALRVVHGSCSTRYSRLPPVGRAVYPQ
jgi:hypothetical protein